MRRDGGAAPEPDPGPVAPHPRLLLTPAILDERRAFAAERRTTWTALRAACDRALQGDVEWPDGDDYPPAGSVGEGYQGDGYLHPLLALGLCHQVTRSTDPARARDYARKGCAILDKMSEPSGPHAVDPLRDSGFGIRFYGVGLALGYDWLHDEMSPALAARVRAALHRWIDAYERRGFGRDHAQGNYFAGYFAAKGLAALALDGDDPAAPAMWSDWRGRLYGRLVQPYYARWLDGGGWPEGWNYGALGTLNMIWPVFGATTARGLDLVHDARAPFRFPVDQAAQIIHFSWPSRRTIDDRGSQYAGVNPSALPVPVVVTLSGLLAAWRDPMAPALHRFAREARAASAPGAVEPWMDFLFWDERAPEEDLKGLPRSFVARGMSTAAMRSSFDADAVWASFTAGPYVGNPESGEMFYDQGGFAVVRGAEPFVVNATTALLRHSPGTGDGGGDTWNRIYADLYGNHAADAALGNRTLFNVLYLRTPRMGQYAVVPPAARTRIEGFLDAGPFVVARGEHLEDMYRNEGARGPLDRWTRRLVYVRPRWFVVEDRTEVAPGPGGAPIERWQAFHVGGVPREMPAPEGAHRFDVAGRGGFVGAVTALLPSGSRVSAVDVFQLGKVYRLEVRPAAPARRERWLVVFDAAPAPAVVAPVSLVRAGPASGARIGRVGSMPRQVVVLGPDEEDALHGPLAYRVPAIDALHVLTGVAADARYAVAASADGGDLAITLSPGGPLRADAGGVLFFATDPGGRLVPP